jgi:hypothetical protein
VAASDRARREFANTQSSTRIGNHVHAKLQEAYETFHRTSTDVISEMWDPNAVPPQWARMRRPGWHGLSVCGVATEGRRIPLDQVIDGPHDPDHFFAAVKIGLSWLTLPVGDHQSTLRADLIDRYLCSIWEIKPIRKIVDGVFRKQSIASSSTSRWSSSGAWASSPRLLTTSSRDANSFR